MKTKLRELAKDCPECMGCGLQNPNRELICLAHSNSLADGRGTYHKSNDLYGAYLCSLCHLYVDSSPKATKQEKREYHKQAWIKTMRWWIDNGHVKPS